MAYNFDQVFAADPANPANIAQNASVTIFEPGDVAMTPIAITDTSGTPLPNPIPVNANGFGPAFMASIDRVAWEGGGFTGFFTSYEGMKQVALDAQSAAENAAATAGADAAAVAAAAIGDATADAAAAQAAAEAAAVSAANAAATASAPADTAIAAAVTNSGSASRAALNATYATASALAGKADSSAVAGKLDIFGALEAVPFINFGDSYGNGSQGADQVSRPFNRLSVRHRTQTLNVKSVAGTRMDEIAAAVAANWTPNSRGLVGISDGVLNDEVQYGDTTGVPTTREAFRTALAYLTARAVSAYNSAAFTYAAGWTAGTSSTAASTFDFAFTATTGYLLVNFVTGAGGTLTIRAVGGATVATVSTGGYKQNFTGAVKIPGAGTGPATFRATLDSGTVTVVGVAAGSPYPPVILWDKPAQFNSDTTRLARVNAYLSACAAILTDFPTVIQVDMGAGWDYTTMISEDGLHRNDAGNLFAANRISAELATYLGGGFKQGLNRLNQGTGAATAYTTPTPDFSNTYSLDTFTRANSTSLGTTETGAYAWTTPYPAGWVISGNGLVASATATTGSQNDCLVNDGQANGTFSLTRASNSSSSGLVFRISADGTTGYLVYRSGSNYLLAKRTSAAAYTTLATSAGITPNVGDVIKVIANGSSIKAYVNGVLAADVTDASYTGTRHGAWTNSNVASSFDSWSHTDKIS
jgi:hypothetical protein